MPFVKRQLEGPVRASSLRRSVSFLVMGNGMGVAGSSLSRTQEGQPELEPALGDGPELVALDVPQEDGHISGHVSSEEESSGEAEEEVRPAPGPPLPLFFGQVMDNLAPEDEDEYLGFGQRPAADAVHPLTTLGALSAQVATSATVVAAVNLNKDALRLHPLTAGDGPVLEYGLRILFDATEPGTATLLLGGRPRSALTPPLPHLTTHTPPPPPFSRLSDTRGLFKPESVSQCQLPRRILSVRRPFPPSSRPMRKRRAIRLHSSKS